jgi:DNA replication ATP-dependent helicase Dna2
LLYYSQLDSILRVEAKSNEIRALIIARNELAGWLAKQRTAWAELAPVQPPPAEVADIEDTFLPPTIDHSRECKSCYAVDTCMLYRKVSGSPTGLKPGTHELTLPKTVDRVDATPDDPIAQLYEDKAGHLTERDAVFFRKWESLVTVEEQELGRFRSQLWTMTAKQREKTGR